MIGKRRRREKQVRPGRAETPPSTSAQRGRAWEGPREQVGTALVPGTPTTGARSPQPRAVPQGKASARKMNDASRATGAPASRTGARYGEPVPGRDARSAARSAREAPARLRGQADTLAHPRRAGPGDGGLRPAAGERRASRPPSTANPEGGLLICRHRFTTGPGAPACFDRDVTSEFFFRFRGQHRAASRQPGGWPGPLPPPRRAGLGARALQGRGHFTGSL